MKQEGYFRGKGPLVRVGGEPGEGPEHLTARGSLQAPERNESSKAQPTGLEPEEAGLLGGAHQKPILTIQGSLSVAETQPPQSAAVGVFVAFVAGF